MEADLNIRHVKIEKMEDEFKGLLSNLEYYKSMYNSSNSNTYIGLYNNTLKDYNNRYNEYEQANGEYNDIVAVYNALLK